MQHAFRVVPILSPDIWANLKFQTVSQLCIAASVQLQAPSPSGDKPDAKQLQARMTKTKKPYSK
jgi:hypothetical protein